MKIHVEKKDGKWRIDYEAHGESNHVIFARGDGSARVLDVVQRIMSGPWPTKKAV